MTDMSKIDSLVGGGTESIENASIPSTYASGGIYNESILIDNNCTLEPKVQIYREQISTMYKYAEYHIPNYMNITTYPNDIQYNPNTTGVINFVSAFANLKNCSDTIGSIINRFDWSSCKTIQYVFYNCRKLTGQIPEFPKDLAYMKEAFTHCRNLTGAIPKIPEGIQRLDYTFYDCSNLSGITGDLPTSITNLESCFEECSNLTGTIPNIPENVFDVADAFWGCSKFSSSDIYVFSNKINYANRFTVGCKNTMNIYVHANTTTYNAFYKAMGNSTYNASWGPAYLKTF